MRKVSPSFDNQNIKGGGGEFVLLELTLQTTLRVGDRGIQKKAQEKSGSISPPRQGIVLPGLSEPRSQCNLIQVGLFL